VSAGVVRVVGIIVELDEVSCVVDTSESLVGNRAHTQVDHHGSLSCRNHLLSFFNIVSELNGISKDIHPGFADIGVLRFNWVISWRTNIHDFLSH